MDNSDQAKFAQMIISVGEYFEKELSDSTISLYFEGLKKYDFEAVKDACSRYMQMPEGKWMPKVADMVGMIEGGTNDSALRAWADIHKAIRLAGPYRSIVSDDAITLRVVDEMGGWIYLCDVTKDELPFRAKEFEARYRAYKQSGLDEYPRKLIGKEELSALAYDIKPPAPYIIGDIEQARLVYKNGSASIQRITSGDSVKKVMEALPCTANKD